MYVEEAENSRLFSGWMRFPEELKRLTDARGYRLTRRVAAVVLWIAPLEINIVLATVVHLTWQMLPTQLDSYWGPDGQVVSHIPKQWLAVFAFAACAKTICAAQRVLRRPTRMGLMNHSMLGLVWSLLVGGLLIHSLPAFAAIPWGLRVVTLVLIYLASAGALVSLERHVFGDEFE